MVVERKAGVHVVVEGWRFRLEENSGLKEQSLRGNMETEDYKSDIRKNVLTSILKELLKDVKRIH